MLFYSVIFSTVLVLSPIAISGDTTGSNTFTNKAYQDLVAQYGTGFKRSYGCGEYMDSLAGGIFYKVGQPISPQGEVCVWTIVAPKKTTIEVTFLEDGFDETCGNCDIITIYKMTSTSNPTFSSAAVIVGNTAGRSYNVTGGSLIQIVFTSPGRYNQTGFALYFHGIGNDTTATIQYKVYEQTEPSGAINYRANYTDETDSHYEFAVSTLHPEVGKKLAFTLESVSTSSWYPTSCGGYWDILGVTEFAWSSGIYITATNRLSECNFSGRNITILSSVPLRITYYTHKARRHYFDVSWENV